MSGRTRLYFGMLFGHCALRPVRAIDDLVFGANEENQLEAATNARTLTVSFGFDETQQHHQKLHQAQEAIPDDQGDGGQPAEGQAAPQTRH